MTPAERRAALDEIAAEVRGCTRCRLHETRTNAVPGEGHPDTEVMFVGEGPGFNEDRLGRPFVGRAGDFLVRLLGSIEWRRDEVFITNVVKCRPPDNRDPEPDEIEACAPYLRRQLEALDPSVIVTLGRHSMGRFMPGARISQAHGTVRPADPATGAGDASVFAMYHPAAALRTPTIAEESFRDIDHVPEVLLAARDRRRQRAEAGEAALGSGAASVAGTLVAEPVEPPPDAVTTAEPAIAAEPEAAVEHAPGIEAVGTTKAALDAAADAPTERQTSPRVAAVAMATEPLAATETPAPVAVDPAPISRASIPPAALPGVEEPPTDQLSLF